MIERELLMIPGPTNVDPRVLRALCRPPLSHVSIEFAEIFKNALSNLKQVFMTNGEVFAIAGSGTLALEMAIANVVEPGDKVLNCVSGYFGQYFVEISKVFGAVPSVLEVSWGSSIKPEMVEDALRKDNYKAVTVTHVETSTGVANPIKEIGEVVKKYGDTFYIVDTVASLGGMEVRVDDWGIDICASGSQKCIGVPPGLALIAVGRKTLEYLDRRKSTIGTWYGSFKNWLPIMRDPTKYFATPAVNMIYALDESLKLILDEGLEDRFKRHRVMAEAFRAAITALGLRLVAEERYASDTVSAVYYPENVDDGKFRSEMKKCGIIVAGMLGPLRGKGFRVGHMGNVNQNDILSMITAIETSLRKLGHSTELGRGVAAAQEKLVNFK